MFLLVCDDWSFGSRVYSLTNIPELLIVNTPDKFSGLTNYSGIDVFYYRCRVCRALSLGLLASHKLLERRRIGRSAQFAKIHLRVLYAGPPYVLHLTLDDENRFRVAEQKGENEARPSATRFNAPRRRVPSDDLLQCVISFCVNQRMNLLSTTCANASGSPSTR